MYFVLGLIVLVVTCLLAAIFNRHFIGMKGKWVWDLFIVIGFLWGLGAMLYSVLALVWKLMP